MRKKTKIVFVIGTTSSGKSDLAVHLAKQFNGEVISADSRQIYNGLNYCTGKITQEEMQGIPHHMLSFLEPGKRYSAHDFQKDCYKKIKEILKRKKNVFIVGGTGFYTRAVAEGYGFSSGEDKNLHAILEEKSLEELQNLLTEHNGKINPSDYQNKRRVLRAVELAMTNNTQKINKPKFEVLQLLTYYPREVLSQRIKQRLVERINCGMVDEIKGFIDNGIDPQFFINLGLECKNATLFLQGKLTKDEFLSKAYLDIKHFAKRQDTWYKKEKNVVKIDMLKTNAYTLASSTVEKFLNEL